MNFLFIVIGIGMIYLGRKLENMEARISDLEEDVME